MNMRRVSLKTLSAITKLVHFEVRCQSYCSKASDVKGKKDTPKYNYALEGKGKGKTYLRKGGGPHHQQASRSVQSEGEIVFGLHPVTLALSSHHRSHFYTLYLDQKHRDVVSRHREGQSSSSSSSSTTAFHGIRELAARLQVPVQYVSKNTLMRLAGNRPHQGVCLDASPRHLPHCRPHELLQGVDLTSGVLWLLLYNIQDPMNFGAILRTCHYLGVDRVVVPSVNSCALSPVVSKASAGAMEVMDLHQIDGNYLAIRHLTQGWRSAGGMVVGTASENHSCLPVCRPQDITTSAPILLIVGNEGSGIDVDVVEMCDTLLTIPPAPPSSSPAHLSVSCLNVSVATGILIHWLRASASAK